MMEIYVSPHIVTNSRLLILLDDIPIKTPVSFSSPKPNCLGFHRAAIRVVHKMTVSHG